MDKPNPITRRATLVGAAVSSVALAVPAVAAVKASASPSVADLFGQWQAVCARVSDSQSDDEANVHMRAYWRLQRRIGAMRPATAREAAMQFMVETDDGESDYRNAFYRRVRKLALGA